MTQKRGSGTRMLPTAPRGPFLPMMVAAHIASLALALACGVVAWVVGPPGAVGSSVAGVLVASVFLSMGALGVRVVLAGSEGSVVLGALGVYFTQITGLLTVLMITPQGAIPQPGWFAASAIVETVVWQAAQAVALRHTRVFVFSGVAMPPAVDDSLPRTTRTAQDAYEEAGS